MKAIWVRGKIIVVDEDEHKAALVIFGSACVPYFDQNFPEE